MTTDKEVVCRARDYLNVALGGNMNVATLTPLAITELIAQYAEPIQAKLTAERKLSDRLAEALEECEVKWGCECPYCDRNYGESFEEHATETNGASFECKLGALLTDYSKARGE